MVGRVVEVRARTYARTWRASVFSSFVNPALLLGAMGLGLGTLVDAASLGSAGPVGYLQFIAPGLLAANAMQTAASESAWPVLGGLKWTRSYPTALATPISVGDLTAGHLIWTGVRIFQVSLVFAGVAILLGGMPAAAGLAGVLPATLCGLAFAGPITWFTLFTMSETALSAMFRLFVIPVFLFSGTFFPIDRLPDWIQPVVPLTPLWHGVELTRSITTDIETAWPAVLHLAVLVIVGAAGAAGTHRLMRRRLLV